MASEQARPSAQRQTLSGRKNELIQRDPLKKELVDALAALYQQASTAGELDRLSQRCAELRGRLEAKYRVRTYLMPRAAWLELKEDEARVLAIGVAKENEAVIQYATNWEPPLWVQTIRKLSKLHRRSPPRVLRKFMPKLSIGEPATLMIKVNLRSVTLRDAKAVGRRCAQVIRDKLKALPDVLRKPPSRRDPSDLAFLPRLSDATFNQELRRYDLFVTYGLSLRQIALSESMQRAGRSVPGEPARRRVGWAVKGEDAVEKSVRRIYRVLHGRDLVARRRRLDVPPHEAGFSCPSHPDRDCSIDCPDLARWWKRIQGTLPYLS